MQIICEQPLSSLALYICGLLKFRKAAKPIGLIKPLHLHYTNTPTLPSTGIHTLMLSLTSMDICVSVSRDLLPLLCVLKMLLMVH
jgi:hypothetical protein